ncbi:MAG: hypothetical protein KGJ57_06430 [Sphingomonadales bacterium]|nr:hypothetical protein [Sphingomonadales bacterium]MDE2169056.1 hypothetical protein [Sphingomonadales bacterium]
MVAESFFFGDIATLCKIMATVAVGWSWFRGFQFMMLPSGDTLPPRCVLVAGFGQA